MYDLNHKLHFVDKDKNHHSLNLFTEQKDCVADISNQTIDSSHMIVVTTVDGPRYCPVAYTNVNSDENLCVNTSDGVRYSYNKKVCIEVYAISEIVDTSGGYETSFKEIININGYALNSALNFDVVIKVYDKDKNLKIERTIKKGVANVSLDSPESFTQDYDKNKRGQYYVKVYSKADYEESSLKVNSYAYGMVLFIDITSHLSSDVLFLDFSKDEFYQVINGMELKGGMQTSSGLNFQCSANPLQVSGLWWYNMQSKIRIRNSDEAIASGLPEYNVYAGDWTLYIPGGTGYGYGEGNFTWTVRRYTSGQKDLTNEYCGSSRMTQNGYLAVAILDDI